MFFKKKNFRNFSKSFSSSKELYILSAVRTPIGLSKGVLSQFTAPQLFSFAFKEALQRAVVPSEDISNVFLACSSCHNCNKEILKRTGLSKAVKISLISTCGIRNFINGAKFLLTNNQNVCVVGGAVCGPNNIENKEDNIEMAAKYFKQNILEEFVKFDYKNFINACKNGEFYDEIAKINFRKKGEQIIVTEDELPGNDINFNYMNEQVTNLKYSLTFAGGAVALVIATEDYVQKNNLTPMAKIISFVEESVKLDDFPCSQCTAIEKALKIGGYQCKDISRWEIDSAMNDMYQILINHFKVNPSVVNKNGSVLTLNYPDGLSGARALCHLAHSLSFGDLGCTASCDLDQTATAVIIKKFYGKRSGTPRLTLFTKKSCSLCEELKEQLKPFEGRFSLREVDIEAEGNEKYEELYKYEIPVLFLEGRFLCKHKLEIQHFCRRLSELENSD